jgi:hypothetical protein
VGPEPESSSPYSQQPATGPYLEPTGSTLHPPASLPKIHSDPILPSTPWSSPPTSLYEKIPDLKRHYYCYKWTISTVLKEMFTRATPIYVGHSCNISYFSETHKLLESSVNAWRYLKNFKVRSFLAFRIKTVLHYRNIILQQGGLKSQDDLSNTIKASLVTCKFLMVLENPWGTQCVVVDVARNANEASPATRVANWVPIRTVLPTGSVHLVFLGTLVSQCCEFTRVSSHLMKVHEVYDKYTQIYCGKSEVKRDHLGEPAVLTRTYLITQRKNVHWETLYGRWFSILLYNMPLGRFKEAKADRRLVHAHAEAVLGGNIWRVYKYGVA